MENPEIIFKNIFFKDSFLLKYQRDLNIISINAFSLYSVLVAIPD